jgi:hypothetical protein
MLGLERHCIAAASGVARAELSRRGVADEHARTRASRGGGTSLRSGGWLKTAARRDGTFFFSVVEKHECRKRKTLLELHLVRPSPRPRHAVNFRHRVSVCTALHFLLQNRMPHRAQL